MNNFANNMNGFNPYNGGMVGGVYNQIQQPKMSSGLSPEKINEMKNVRNTFSLQPTELEQDQDRCYHRFNGAFTTVSNGDGTVTCTTCHRTFEPKDLSEEEVMNITQSMIDLLQTIKLLYVDMPDGWSTYFQMISMLSKVPQLYKTANDCFRRYDGGMNIQAQNNMNAFNALAMISNPAANVGMMGMNPMIGNPGMMGGMSQPQMNPGMMGGMSQPQMNPGMMGGMSQYPSAGMVQQGMMNNGVMPSNPYVNQQMMNSGSNGFGVNMQMQPQDCCGAGHRHSGTTTPQPTNPPSPDAKPEVKASTTLTV